MFYFSLAINNFFKYDSIYERIEIAGGLGYSGVDLSGTAYNCDLNKIKESAKNSGVVISGMTVNDVEQTVLNQNSKNLLSVVYETLDSAAEIGCKTVYISCGSTLGNGDYPKNLVIENLRRIVERAEKCNVTICIKPKHSKKEQPAQFLDSTVLALEIVRAIDSDYLKVYYDVYNMQLMEGNIIQTIKNHYMDIGYISISGVPEQIEPFYGEVNAALVLDEISKYYKGFIVLDYFPSYDSLLSASDSLKYVNNFRVNSATVYKDKALLPKNIRNPKIYINK